MMRWISVTKFVKLWSSFSANSWRSQEAESKQIPYKTGSDISLGKKNKQKKRTTSIL